MNVANTSQSTVLIVHRSCEACVPASSEEPLLKYGQERTTVECPSMEASVLQR